VASEGAVYVSRNVDAFAYNYDNTNAASDLSPYNISLVAPSDAILSASMIRHLSEVVGPDMVKTGLNVTADSFYSGQGRVDPNFQDLNADLIDLVIEKYPRAASMVLDWFLLLHLAKCSKKPVYASAAAIPISNRRTGIVASGAAIEYAEIMGAVALLKALAEFPFPPS
jgi:uridine phosphorylase